MDSPNKNKNLNKFEILKKIPNEFGKILYYLCFGDV